MADPRLVEQLEAVAGPFGLAGQGPQLGGVPQRRHRCPVGPPSTVGGPHVDRQQPVADAEHLVGAGRARGEQLAATSSGRGPQVGDATLLGVRGQVEQAPRLVVGQQQPAVAAEDQHAFADGVQHRVVVFVHTGHLGRAQPVGLPAQPPGHQRRTRRGQREGDAPAPSDEQGQLPVGDTADLLDLDARPTPGRRPCRRASSTGTTAWTAGRAVPLIVWVIGVPGQRLRDVPDELLPDPVRVGMGVADALGVGHDDEVDAGRSCAPPPPAAGARGGAGRAQRRHDAGRMREGLGDRQRAVAGVHRGVVPGLRHDLAHRGGHQQQDDDHLQDEHLTRDAAGAPHRPQAPLRRPFGVQCSSSRSPSRGGFADRRPAPRPVRRLRSTRVGPGNEIYAYMYPLRSSATTGGGEASGPAAVRRPRVPGRAPAVPGGGHAGRRRSGGAPGPAPGRYDDRPRRLTGSGARPRSRPAPVRSRPCHGRATRLDPFTLLAAG